MKATKLVEQLTEAVEKLQYRVRIEQGRFKGGSCVLEDEKLIIINRRLGDEERAEILARALAAENLEDIYLKPEVREFVERYAHSEQSESNDS